MGNMKIANYIISGIGAVIAIVIIVMASKLSISPGTGDPGAGFWPLLLGALLLGLSILLFVVSFVSRKKLEENTFTLSLPANKRVYISIGLIIGFCVVLYLLGFYIAALIFIPIMMWILDEKRIKVIGLTTILTVGGIWLIFGLLLHIQLPPPIFV